MVFAGFFPLLAPLVFPEPCDMETCFTGIFQAVLSNNSERLGVSDISIGTADRISIEHRQDVVISAIFCRRLGVRPKNYILDKTS